MKQPLTHEEKTTLLEIARETIMNYIATGTIPEPHVTSPNLLEKRGCFVTIKQDGSLRGCIGNFVSEHPLYKLVQEMAISAATRDPRFYPMKKKDLSNFALELSVLSPMEKIASVDQVIIGTHGLYLEKNSHRGVLLPQVATEYKWDLTTFLSQTCVKAGLPPDAWKEGADIYIFSAEIF